jgi:hypothetical protein
MLKTDDPNEKNIALDHIGTFSTPNGLLKGAEEHER